MESGWYIPPVLDDGNRYGLSGCLLCSSSRRSIAVCGMEISRIEFSVFGLRIFSSPSPFQPSCLLTEMVRRFTYDFVHRLGRPEKDAALAEIIAEQRERSFRTYGYRRMWLVLEKRGIHRNPKTVLRIMEKYGLLAEIRRRRKWVNMGQQVHRYENLLNRQFHADRPNSQWVTDISYIHTKQGVLYLSMIRDLYDNSIVAYKTGTQQTVNLVLDTIRLAMRREKKRVAAELHLHSDQGFQYTS